MNSRNLPAARRAAPPPAPTRWPVFFLLLVGMGVAGALWLRRDSRSTDGPPPAEPIMAATPHSAPETPTPVSTDGSAPEPVASLPANTVEATPPEPTPVPPPPAVPGIVPSAHTRQLVQGLTQINFNTPITPESAAAWKQSFQQLTQQGAAAIPAIQEFLARNVDINFGSVDPGNLLGQPSVRFALIDALAQIGGPEGLSALANTLQGTAEPREIALLARNLEAQAPEQYRELAVNAARNALAVAAGGKLPGRDLGPAFGVLQQYGGPNAVADLERASGEWRYYGAIGLVNLPEGAGIPSLIQMASDGNSGQGRVAAEMLAQVADQSEAARDTLLAKARAGQLPNATLMQIASVLGGEKFQIMDQMVNANVPSPGSLQSRTYHISGSNQNFFSYPDPTPFTSEQINQRVGLIDQLLTVARDQIATDALQQARTALLTRPKP